MSWRTVKSLAYRYCDDALIVVRALALWAAVAFVGFALIDLYHL